MLLFCFPQNFDLKYGRKSDLRKKKRWSKVLYSSSVLLKPLPQVLNLVSHAAFGRSPGSCVLLHAASVVPQRGHVRSKQRAANTPERKDAEMKSSVAVILKGHPGCVCGGRGVGGDRGGT